MRSRSDIFGAVDGPLADVHGDTLRDLRYGSPPGLLPEAWMAIRAV